MCAESVETEEHFLLDCTFRKDERAALYDAIGSMVTTARAERDDRNAFSIQQLSRDERWRLLTGGTVNTIGKEELRQRLVARILASIAQWMQERKEALARVDRARQA